jgi:hypothetical protein
MFYYIHYLAGQAILRYIDIRFVMIDPSKNRTFLVIFCSVIFYLVGAILISIYIIISWVNQATCKT